MDLFERTGKMALGSRLRQLAVQVSDDADKIYGMYDIEEFSPKWFPVLFVLWEQKANTITQIAMEIGHSQPSVTKIIKEMSKAGLVQDNLKSNDRRRNVVSLTDYGNSLAEKIIKEQGADVDRAIDGMMAEASHNLWEAIAEWEFLLKKKSLFRRVLEQKKIRGSQSVKIVDYEPEYQFAFRALNEEWISTYFEMEEADYKALDDPGDYIINRGGRILVALDNNEAVGVCALIKMEDGKYDFEMAKMAVSPKAQGKSIGFLLGQKIIETAKSMGASKIYLESNTILKPAINLYYKLGFQKISGHFTPYRRCNIQMELNLKD